MGRPKRYFTEEEIIQAIEESDIKEMVNKKWRCPVCCNAVIKAAEIETIMEGKDKSGFDFMKT